MKGQSNTVEEARATIKAIKDEITAFECSATICTKTIDWGSKSRGQGKRSGHMVTGSMSAAPTGVKTYQGIDLGRYIETDKEREDLKWLRDTYRRVAYDRARQFGCNHIESMVYAYTS